VIPDSCRSSFLPFYHHPLHAFRCPRSLSRRGSVSLCCRSPFPGSFPFWASPFPRRLANASGRIVFNMVLFMDWQFVSGCSPPRLSTTQLPSTTDSQCSVRRGLSPRCWCALLGARWGAACSSWALHVSTIGFVTAKATPLQAHHDTGSRPCRGPRSQAGRTCHTFGLSFASATLRSSLSRISQ
jgi:hypothetical protein